MTYHADFTTKPSAARRGTAARRTRPDAEQRRAAAIAYAAALEVLG